MAKETQIQIRVTHAEKAAIEKAAKRANRPPSVWMREMALLASAKR